MIQQVVLARSNSMCSRNIPYVINRKKYKKVNNTQARFA